MWTPFFFESNKFFQLVSSPTDWKKLQESYPDYTNDQLLAAREATWNGQRSVSDRLKHPNFGLRLEHDGEKTLKDFFIEHGMPLP